MRPGRVLVKSVLGGIFCGALLCFLVWYVHPASREEWASSPLLLLSAAFLAPLLFLLWSIVGPFAWRSRSWFLVKRLVLFHAGAAVILFWVGLSGLTLLRPGTAVILSETGLGGLVAQVDPWASFYAALALATDLPLLALCWTISGEAEIRSFQRGMLILAGGAWLGLWTWSFANIAIVGLQAEALAEGRPYCLQVEKDHLGRYRPVSALFDMTGLKMRTLWSHGGGSADYQFSFHAVLYVDKGNGFMWRNWSYRRQRFVSINSSARRGLALVRPSCEAVPHFIGQLPLTAHGRGESDD